MRLARSMSRLSSLSWLVDTENLNEARYTVSQYEQYFGTR